MTTRKCTLQTHAGPVRLEVSRTGGAEYHGTVAALLASGALTWQMVATRKTRSPNDPWPLHDEKGRQFRLYGMYSYKTRAWKGGAAPVRLWLSVAAEDLPGMRESFSERDLPSAATMANRAAAPTGESRQKATVTYLADVRARKTCSRGRHA